VNEIPDPCQDVEIGRDPKPEQFQYKKGQTIGSFHILEFIGKGGMGEVYRAWDRALKRTVALKFLTTDIDRTDESKERFLREAQTASALEHPNIASVHEIGETQDHQLFIVMGYYPGDSLKKILKSGPLPIDRAVRLVTQLACGVAAAHTHDIIHRDIKPDNIIINESGELRLLDFGLAKFTSATKPTRKGGIMGTVAYMSPEQIRTGIFTTKSDIWSIGVVLYEMLTGQNPFNRGNEASTIYTILKGDPIAKASSSHTIPSRLRQILKRCLTKDENRRYASAAELLADLKKLATEAPAKKPRLSMGQYGLVILVSVMGLSWMAGHKATRYECAPHPAR
jgi:serine/threonine-protein kinase